MAHLKGKVIALYGINNLGKTTQRQLLEERLRASEQTCVSYKYARYDVPESGTMLNNYLRKGNPYGLSPREFQTIQALNKTQVEPILRSYVDRGDMVVIEDYVGTGIAWGIGSGVDREYLFQINRHLLKEDVSILLDGSRFLEGVEKGHAHESNDMLTERVRDIHLELARVFGWKIVNANRSREEVHEDIWSIVKNVL